MTHIEIIKEKKHAEMCEHLAEGLIVNLICWWDAT